MTSLNLRQVLLSSIFVYSAIFFTLFSTNSYSQTFTFTAIPDQDETRLKQRFDQVAVYLQNALEVDVQYIPVKSYSAAVSAFRNNQVQLAWFGGLSGVQARRLVPGSHAIAQGFEDQYFKTLIIANTQTGLKKSAQLPKEVSIFSFTFGSKGSTSGRLMPEFYLQKFYGKPSKDTFKHLGFSGDHSRTIALVKTGAYDLGAVNFKVWEQALRDPENDLSEVKVIWETPHYPDYQWTIRGDADEFWGAGFSEKVKQTLLSIDQAKLLNAFPRSKFVSADSSDYKVILETAQAIGLID